MRIAIVFFFASFFTLSLNAQKLQFGPELALNIIPTESSDIGTDFMLAPSAGIYVAYPLGQKFLLSSGAYYQQSNQKYSRQEVGGLFDDLGGLFGIDPAELLDIDGVNLNTNINIEGKYTLKAVQLPLLVEYNCSDLIQFFVGGYGNLLIGARSKQVTETTVPILQAVDISVIDPDNNFGFLIPDPEEREFTESSSKLGLNRYDFGATAGFGLSFNQLQIRLSYSYGFVDYLVDEAAQGNRNTQYARIGLLYRL